MLPYVFLLMLPVRLEWPQLIGFEKNVEEVSAF